MDVKKGCVCYWSQPASMLWLLHNQILKDLSALSLLGVVKPNILFNLEIHCISDARRLLFKLCYNVVWLYSRPDTMLFMRLWVIAVCYSDTAEFLI